MSDGPALVHNYPLPASVTVHEIDEFEQEKMTVIELAGLTTFQDIRDSLVQAGVVMENRVLVDDRDNVMQPETVLQGHLPPAGLAAKNQLQLVVSHNNQEWIVPVILNSKHTIQSVREYLTRSDGGLVFQYLPLTWLGEVQQNDTRTDELRDIHTLALAGPAAETDDAAASAKRLRLVGKKSLEVMDIDLGQSSSVRIDELTDDMSVLSVLASYGQRVSRELCQPTLVKYLEGETNTESILQGSAALRLDKSIFECGLDDRAVLAVKTAMFEIVLKEQTDIDAALARQKGLGRTAAIAKAANEEVQGVKVHVFDWWKVRQIKEAYSNLVADGITANDQLYIDRHASSSSSSAPAPSSRTFDDELSDEKPLFYYRLRPLSSLIVKREDFSATHCMYICADCGNDVKLKQSDAVRCRECGHRIVFKRRVAKPCQYECR